MSLADKLSKSWSDDLFPDPVPLAPFANDQPNASELARRLPTARGGWREGRAAAARAWLRFDPVATVEDSASALRPEAFDPATRRFRPMEGRVVVLPKEMPYAQGTAAALRTRDCVENLSGGNVALAEIAALSRWVNTLVGATSFIVVENSAQREILRRKEAQKPATPGLEVEEAVPKPAT